MYILKYISQQLNLDLVLEWFQRAKGGLVAKLIIKKKLLEKIQLELKIMLIGTKGSGKTTLLGVLLTNKLDDGSGSARVKILNHKHEVMTGETSSLTLAIIGMDEEGNVVSEQSLNKVLSNQESYRKLVSFIDIGNYEQNSRQFLHSYLIY